MREAALELATNTGVTADEIASAEQEIEEVEAPGAVLELVVGKHDGPELVPELRCQVGARIGDEAREPRLQGVPPLAKLRLRKSLGGRSEADPVRVPVALEADEVGLEAVVVPGADGLGARHVVHEPRDLRERPGEEVVGVSARHPLGERRHLRDEAVDRTVAVEAGRAPPRGREVAPLHERVNGAAEQPARSVLAGAAAEDAPDAGSRVGEHGLEPAVEGAVEERAGDVVRRHLEERVDAGLDRPLAQEVGAEGVDRPDARLLQLRERAGEELARLGRATRLLPRAFDLAAEPELQLARRRVREGDRHHAVEASAPRHEDGHHAPDELGRLAGSRGSLDHERRVQVASDALARVLIGERHGHRSARRRMRSPSRSAGLRATRASSCGPQTVA